MAKLFGVHVKAPKTVWTAVTPVLTGYPGATNIEVEWARDGGDLLYRGKFTSGGTVSAIEGRVGLPGSLVSADITLIPSLQQSGTFATNFTNTTHGGLVLIEPSVPYFTFTSDGVFGASSIVGFSKVNASSMVAPNTVVAFTARIPIQGWSPNDMLRISDDSKV